MVIVADFKVSAKESGVALKAPWCARFTSSQSLKSAISLKKIQKTYKQKIAQSLLSATATN
jgi:hypothetical protein